MSTSKVAYLSKYITNTETDTNNNDDQRKHHRRNKKSHKARRHAQETAASQSNSLIDIDTDIDIVTTIPSKSRNNVNIGDHARSELDDHDGDDDEENEPVVVMDMPVPSNDIHSHFEAHVPRGTWDSEISAQWEDDNEIDRTASSPPKRHRRQRHDSSSDDDTKIKAVPKKQRHDSEEEADFDQATSLPHIPNHRRRRRHDSSSEEEEEVESHDKHPHSRHHQDSDHERDRPHRKRHDSSDSSGSSNNNSSSNNNNSGFSIDNDSDKKKSHRPQSTERMSSGHRAGIQTSTDFTRREGKLRQKKRDETNDFVRQHGAGGADTIYRDRASGQKLTDPQLHPPQKRDGKNQVVISTEEQRILNTGRVQLEREEQMKLEFQKIQESQFARHRDDAELDMILKNKIHADDPMAAHAMKQKQSSSIRLPQDGGIGGDTTVPHQAPLLRPLYKGPPPKPNRFQIPPGYRWDARDRGNGFEDQLLAKKYNSNHQQEQAYRYSAADM